MTPLKQKLTIEQGRTFRLPVRWESENWSYVPISAIPKAAPCVVTATAHAIPDGWRVAVVSVAGMVEINAATSPPTESDFRKARLLSVNQIEFNDLNTSGFSTYVSGGYLQFRTPVVLTGYTARMVIKDKIGGTVLLTLTTENGGISINNTTKVVELLITATATAAITWKSGVYDLEMIAPGGDITALLVGSVVVVLEVTT